VFISRRGAGDTLVRSNLGFAGGWAKKGVGTFGTRFGGGKKRHALHAEIETKKLQEKMWFYTIDAEKNTATFQALDSTFKVRFPLNRFLAAIGCRSANGEARSSVPGRSWRQHGRAAVAKQYLSLL